MYNEAKLTAITQSLALARQRQKLNPRDTMETLTYIAHVEALLLELDNAFTMNQLQANNIRNYVRQLEHNRSLQAHQPKT